MLVYHFSGSKLYDLDAYLYGMRLARECRHCGREFEGNKSEFCSYKCAEEVS